MKETRFRVPRKKQPFFSLVKLLLRPFYRKPKLLLAEPLQEKCILVANHSAKSGPMGLELYLPLFSVKWGAHEMLEGYSARRKYLKEVFYMQKMGYGRVRAGAIAAFEAVFSKMVYRGVKVIASYPDARLIRTLRQSEKVLSENVAVVVFPENSDGGYFEEMTEFHPGFVLLAQYYLEKTGEDLPVYPCYYHTKKHIMAVGKAESANALLARGMTKEEVAAHFKDRVNALFREFCK